MVTIPFELIQAIQAGECVLWAGAGVGALAGRPLKWRAMLETLIALCPASERRQLHDLLDQGRLRPVLSFAHRHLGERAQEALQAGTGEDGEPAELAPGAELLTALPWRACFATTCADAIQQIYAATGVELPVLSHLEVHSASLRAHGDRFVLRTPPTARSMRADAALFEVVEEVVRTQTILFLGFDVDDPDFAQIRALLERVGRGRRHFAWMPFVTRAESEEMLETHGIEVISPSDSGDVVRAVYAIHRTLWSVPARPSTADVDAVALDLKRALSGIPLRADLAVDEALSRNVAELDLLLGHLPHADLGAVDLGSLLRLGSVMLVSGRHLEARRFYREVQRRGSGREFQNLARFNLALLDHIDGEALAAVDALNACAREDRTVALVPPRFEIVEIMGRQGARVHLACQDLVTSQEVDVSVAAFHRPVGTHEQARFTRDVQRAAGGTHPAVQRIHGGFTDGRLFGVLCAPVSGCSLADLLTAGEGGQRLELMHALDLFIPLLDGLASLHARGVPHRTINPRQILITEDGPVLLSPGFLPCTSFRRPSVRAANLGYTAPEVLAGAEPTAASDVYALAAVLYRCLTGRVVVSTMQPPSAYNHDLDPRFDRVLAHALHAEPGVRLSPRRLRTELVSIRDVPLVLVSRMDMATVEPVPVMHGDPTAGDLAYPTA